MAKTICVTKTTSKPMHHLVSGIRYSLLGYEESSLLISSLTAGLLAAAAFSFTVFLFKSGYKLRS